MGKWLYGLVGLSLWCVGVTSADEGIWIIKEDFVRLGKKELYEQYIGKEGKDKKFPLYAYAMESAPDYVCLVPVSSFADIDTLEGDEQKLQKTAAQILSSALNFRMSSIHREITSAIPALNEQIPFSEKLTMVHYWTYGIAPAAAGPFEEHIAQKLSKQKEGRGKTCWRVWRALYGSDTPRYVIAVFCETKEESQKVVSSIDFITPISREIIRNTKEGDGVFRMDLSSLGGESG